MYDACEGTGRNSWGMMSELLDLSVEVNGALYKLSEPPVQKATCPGSRSAKVERKTNMTSSCSGVRMGVEGGL